MKTLSPDSYIGTVSTIANLAIHIHRIIYNLLISFILSICIYVLNKDIYDNVYVRLLYIYIYNISLFASVHQVAPVLCTNAVHSLWGIHLKANSTKLCSMHKGLATSKWKLTTSQIYPLLTSCAASSGDSTERRHCVQRIGRAALPNGSFGQLME